MASDYLAQDLDSSTAHVILGHLSEHNNHPAIVEMIASQALDGRGLLAPQVAIAAQNTCSEVYRF
jgi:hypothetical protein